MVHLTFNSVLKPKKYGSWYYSLWLEQVAWERWLFQASCYPIPRVSQIHPATTAQEYTLSFLSFTPSQGLDCCILESFSLCLDL